jgi:hypothetical protein
VNYSYKEKCFRQTFHENSKHTFYVQERFSDKYAYFTNVQKYGTAGKATDDSIIWRMHISRRAPQATYTFSEYAILRAFPRQQWLRYSLSGTF